MDTAVLVVALSGYFEPKTMVEARPLHSLEVEYKLVETAAPTGRHQRIGAGKNTDGNWSAE